MQPAIDLTRLSRDQKIRAITLLREKARRSEQRRFFHMFPDETHDWHGQTMYARHLYARHLEYFKAGSTYPFRMFRAANRVGKTAGACFEDTCHLTGLYPDWWEGRRFDGPIDAWVAGKNYETTRDILQKELLGAVTGSGPSKDIARNGMIPGHLLGKPTWRAGSANSVDTIPVEHVSGKFSSLGFKSYEQGRGSFEGTAKDLIHIDEEPPMDVYSEAAMRVLSTKGMVTITFTPLQGMTEVVEMFDDAEMLTSA